MKFPDLPRPCQEIFADCLRCDSILLHNFYSASLPDSFSSAIFLWLINVLYTWNTGIRQLMQCRSDALPLRSRCRTGEKEQCAKSEKVIWLVNFSQRSLWGKSHLPNWGLPGKRLLKQCVCECVCAHVHVTYHRTLWLINVLHNTKQLSVTNKL